MEEKYMQLYDSVLSEHRISCDNCDAAKATYGLDDVQSCEFFYAAGWRKRTKTYCPKCAKKKLKNLN